MSHLIDKKIGGEVDGEIISDVFQGYIFKITGGIDKDGFGMKNGVLTAERKKLLLSKESSGIRFRRNFNRVGSRIRKLVRGCIVSPDIRMLHLKIIKTGNTPIDGLTNPECAVPKRLAPKRANKILKDLGIADLYNKKKSNPEERKTLRYMITKFANKREVETKNGKKYTKRPKIQRLITPLRLRRKRILRKTKKDNYQYTKEQKKIYNDTFKKLSKKTGKNKAVKKTSKA